MAFLAAYWAFSERTKTPICQIFSLSAIFFPKGRYLITEFTIRLPLNFIGCEIR
jgi:hypothetical protein